MSLDILAALDATPQRTGNTCKIQAWLDAIPDDAPGRSELETILSTNDRLNAHHRTLDQIVALLGRLGFKTSDVTVRKHRVRACGCYR